MWETVGRSWFLKSLRENQIGRQIASPLVSAFSDPLLEGYGMEIYLASQPISAELALEMGLISQV